MRRAVIDVGSNSVLLLVSERQGLDWVPIRESTAVTALGEGTKQTGVLSEAAIDRTLAALREAFAQASDLGAECRAFATMAARIASNTADFQSRAEAQNTPVAVLSGDDEAQLGFLAVANDPAFATEPRISIIDPGGHSTELVTADRAETGWTVGFRRSYPVGTLALRGGLLSAEVLGPLELLRAVREIDDTLGLAYLPNQAGRAVVLGASGTNLVCVRDRILEWDPDRVHGVRLDFEEVSKAVGWLSKMTDQERAAVPGLEKGRERTIHLGALILERFLQCLHVLDVTVSVRGWRHALLADDARFSPSSSA